MFGKIRNFIKDRRPAFVWTVFYAASLWLLMSFMFGFDIFNPFHWMKVPTVRLNGLPGLAFGTLIVATFPIYFATLNFIKENKKTIIPIPFAADKKKEEKKSESDLKPKAENQNPEIALPPNLPPELHELYIRASKNEALRTVKSAFEMNGDHDALPNVPPAPAPKDTDSSFPIPDFDAETKDESSAPMFKEISFDEGGPKFESVFDSKKDSESESVIPGHGAAMNPESGKVQEVEKKLKSLGFETSTDGDIIIASNSKLKTGNSKLAIAVHSDSDFTIADESDWFAAGKQKPSPIAAVLSAAARHDAAPVLYLGANNIMDLADLKTKWLGMGVRVIMDLGDL